METPKISKTILIISWIMSGLIILFMLMDGIMKIVQPVQVVEATTQMGFGIHHIAIIGVCSLIATFFYSIPRTSVLGAILLTAYFGGAIASNFRLDMPLASRTLFPVYLGVITWGGLWLRNEKLRQVFPV